MWRACRIALLTGVLGSPLLAADGSKWQTSTPPLAVKPTVPASVRGAAPTPAAPKPQPAVSTVNWQPAAGDATWVAHESALAPAATPPVPTPPIPPAPVPTPLPVPAVPPAQNGIDWKPLAVTNAPGGLIVLPEKLPDAVGDLAVPEMPAVPAAPDPAPPEPVKQEVPAPKPAPEVISPPKPVLPTTPLPQPSPVPVPTPGPGTAPPADPVWGAAPAGGVPACDPTAPYALPPKRHCPPRLFGSPDVALSRDYPLLDFCGLGLFQDSNAIYLNEGPATDRAFVSAEYLLWWVRTGNVPVLATTSTEGFAGYLGQPGTVTLLGPGRFGEARRDGFRVRAGYWFGDDCRPGQWGVDGSFFFLARTTDSFAADSGTTPILTRPIFAPNFNREFGEQVAFPGASTGRLNVDLESYLWGADVNLRSSICRTCDSRSEWFVGYRHLNLQEELSITENITSLGTNGDPAGTTIVVNDTFDVRNRFHGGQVGYAMGRRAGRWDVDARASVALGVTHQELTTRGSQVRTRPGEAPQSFTGGLLAAGPNLGAFENDEFSVVPEATVNVGYMATPNLRVHVGYNFLYWSNVTRPGDQIDRVVDLSFVPNAPPVPTTVTRPLPTFTQSGFWTQGIQFGAEYRW